MASDMGKTAEIEKVVKAVKILLSWIQTWNESVKEVKSDMVVVRAELSLRFSTPDSPGEMLTMS